MGTLLAFGSLAPAYNFSPMTREVCGETATLARSTWNDNAEPVIDKLGAERAAARAGAFLLGGLLFACIYWRMVGAGRGAVREWLDQNERP